MEKYNYMIINSYIIKGLTNADSKRINNTLLTKKLKIRQKIYSVEIKILSNIKMFEEIYYARIIISDILMGGLTKEEEPKGRKFAFSHRLKNRLKETTTKKNEVYLIVIIKSEEVVEEIKQVHISDKYSFFCLKESKENEAFFIESKKLSKFALSLAHSSLKNLGIVTALDRLFNTRYCELSQDKILFESWLENRAKGNHIEPYNGRILAKIKKHFLQIDHKKISESETINALYSELLLEKKDLLKFLAGFQCIEMITEKSFKKIKKEAISKQINNSNAIRDSEEFSKQVLEPNKPLHVKFIINATFLWKNINNEQCEKFLQFKKLRDDISHGKHMHERGLPVSEVEILASKLYEEYLLIK